MSQKRYAYLIGANGPQTDLLATLKYAEKDAQRLADALLAPHCGFTKAEWMPAESPQPTLAGLNRFMKQCEPADLLLVHFSGHGNYEGQLFLVCNGTDIDDCISSAIKVEDIKSYLDKCKARHKVLILDCCHAGGAYAGLFKGDRGIQNTLQQALGSSCVILSACSRTKTTRELEALDDGEGAGFLSWALTTACTSRFQEVSREGALSLMDIWHWMPTALVMAENGEDALTKSPQRRLVILGGPGTGKTTTLKHFVGCRTKEALGDPNAPIPIFLSLADLARSDKTLQSYLVGLVEELGIERTYAENLWKTIEAGQAFVCLDSLDEVEPQRRHKMIEWVNAWAAESGNTWVVGSRFTEYKNGSFKHGAVR